MGGCWGPALQLNSEWTQCEQFTLCSLHSETEKRQVAKVDDSGHQPVGSLIPLRTRKRHNDLVSNNYKVFKKTVHDDPEQKVLQQENQHIQGRYISEAYEASNKSAPRQAQFDTDSRNIKLDTCATRSISPNLEDFVDML